MGRLSRLDYPHPLPTKKLRKCESMSPQNVPSHSSYRMTRKTPLCRKCGMPMKGHSRSTCLVPKNTEQKDDGTSMILSTPSFVIPETGPFRRQNPNYVPPPPEPLILSSASLTTTEPVFSVNSTTQRSYPPIQQFTPHWSRPSSPQSHCRVPKQQHESPFLLNSASPVTSLFQTSVFGGQQPLAGDSVRLVAGIYQLPRMTVESFRTRALSNGMYCVPLDLLKEKHTQNVDLTRSTWIITGSDPNDVDALVAILHPRQGLVSQMMIWPTAVKQMVRDMDALHYRVFALLLLCIFMFVAILR